MTDHQLTVILKELKIDFSKTIIERAGGGSIESSTEISPREFIRFSKQDFKEGTTKGLVNSITNSKRAIDCQIDSTLSAFGIDIDNIQKSTEAIIKHFDIDHLDLPYKLKLMQALGFVPSGLITTVRNLRHKLEHYYKIPKKEDVEQAIEIAELFCLSIESKTKIMDEDLLITSDGFQYKQKNKKYDLEEILFANQLDIKLYLFNKKLAIVPTKDKTKKKAIVYKPIDPEYYFTIRLLLSCDDQTDFEDCLKIFLTFIRHPMPTKNIRILEYY
jgi:hypothetical protein